MSRTCFGTCHATDTLICVDRSQKLRYVDRLFGTFLNADATTDARHAALFHRNRAAIVIYARYPNHRVVGCVVGNLDYVARTRFGTFAASDAFVEVDTGHVARIVNVYSIERTGFRAVSTSETPVDAIALALIK